MSPGAFPAWALVPFPALVLAIAVLPMVAPRVWERRPLQALVVGACVLPVLGLLVFTSRTRELADAAGAFVSFVATLTALYVAAGGIHVAGDLEGKPSTNAGLLLVGAALASVIGTTGASMLLVRPFLRANRHRRHRAHLVPFFIVAVANAGGLLTPVGDPPLLIGYLVGVPFFWTLRLFPVWILYVGSAAAGLYLVDRRAYAREPSRGAPPSKEPLRVTGRRNVALLLAVFPATLLPSGYAELALVGIAVASLKWTPRAVREANRFAFAPIADVALLSAGIFGSLAPVQAALAAAAPHLPIHRPWQLFWASGLLSAVLDNAPTYTAFVTLASGLHAAPGHALVAGVAPLSLAAISIGSVVMGATTYIGNGPNLMVKAIAEREGFPVPSFFRYVVMAFATMLPAHVVVTVVLMLLER